MPESIPAMATVKRIAVNVNISVNGKPYAREVEPRMLLVEFLREACDLTGTHVGCDTTYCGACTVLMNGLAIKSCTMFAVQADGSEITTVEGLEKDGKLHPIQQAFGDSYGLQCGYCTPGLMLSAHQLLSENPAPSEKEIRKAIAGNTCRCTGYMNIFKGIEDVKMELAEADRPRRAQYKGQGAVAGGNVTIVAGFDLAGTGVGTKVNWQGEAQIFGRLASVAGGLLEPLGKKQIQKLIDG